MTIQYIQEGSIAHIVIDRPSRHNAFDDDLAEKLQAAWRRFEDSDECVAVVSAGTSKHFSVGADLDNMPRNVWRCVPNVGAQVTKPIIAAVHGYAVGAGVALLQAADICVASEDTQLLYSEARVGLAYGLISGLAARVPHKIAMEIMLRGKPFPVARAYEAGLVNRVVPRDDVLAVAMEYARDIAAGAPKVIRWLKEGVDHHVLPDAPAVSALRTMSRIHEMQDSQDLQEGIAAFAEGRTPNFKDQ